MSRSDNPHPPPVVYFDNLMVKLFFKKIQLNSEAGLNNLPKFAFKAIFVKYYKQRLKAFHKLGHLNFWVETKSCLATICILCISKHNL